MAVYLDHNASTPLVLGAREAMARACSLVGNPSSQHRWGRSARSLIDRTRSRLTLALGCKDAELVFTSGGTEACFSGILGLVLGGEVSAVYADATSHKAVLATQPIVERLGVRFELLGVDRRGCLLWDDVAPLADPSTSRSLVVVASANNETGTCHDVRRLTDLAHQHDHLVLCDAVQSFGKEPLNTAEIGVDALAVSAHKVGGPKGCGALFIREGSPFSSWLGGGGQEHGRRGGTENLASICGFGGALEQLPTRLASMKAVTQLRDHLEAGLRALDHQMMVHGDAEARLPNTLNVVFPHVDGEALRVGLDLAGVAISGGSACSSGAVQPSHVLLAMGYDRAVARGALRFSLGMETTMAEIELAIASVQLLLANR